MELGAGKAPVREEVREVREKKRGGSGGDGPRAAGATARGPVSNLHFKLLKETKNFHVNWSTSWANAWPARDVLMGWLRPWE